MARWHLATRNRYFARAGFWASCSMAVAGSLLVLAVFADVVPNSKHRAGFARDSQQCAADLAASSATGATAPLRRTNAPFRTELLHESALPEREGQPAIVAEAIPSSIEGPNETARKVSPTIRRVHHHGALGRLESDVCYVDGLRTGVFREWYSDGTLATWECYADGHLHGSCYTWYPDGTPWTEEFYNRGVCIARKLWAPDGRLVWDLSAIDLENTVDDGSPK